MLKAFTNDPSDYAPSKAPVFYNPVMQLNRDLAVLALQTYQRIINHEISVCEPLTGCGLRGIRFAAEVEGVKKVLVNDISRKAFQLAKTNISLNNLEEKVTAKCVEANVILSRFSVPHRRFDAIDIDPFGSPVRFLDSSIRALRDRGFLALTATDMAPLCGVHPKACIRKYGGKPLRTEYCHELAVRLLAGCLTTVAAKYDIGTKIVFSHRGEHYVRVYSTMKYGAREADESLRKMGHILHCFKCFHREIETKSSKVEGSGLCPECGSKVSIAGPLWTGNLLDPEFLELMDSEANRSNMNLSAKTRRMLAIIKKEPNDVSYYVIDKLCDLFNLPVPSIKEVTTKLTDKGFRGSLTHFNPKGIRSNASASTMKELLQNLTAKRHRNKA
jgi:tRNA (guanine26-N2/guanine27-N2)-dimethyltransferase